MLVTLYLSNGQEKRKKKAKTCISEYSLSHTSSQNLHHTYLYSKNAIPSIVYVPCLCIQNHNFLLCNSMLMGKYQSTVEFIYVSCMFDIFLVGDKLNHAVMEQDFQHCTIFKLLLYTLGYSCLSDVK
jgi:hypothetical protein